jgi:hypothetical protein
MVDCQWVDRVGWGGQYREIYTSKLKTKSHSQRTQLYRKPLPQNSNTVILHKNQPEI